MDSRGMGGKKKGDRGALQAVWDSKALKIEEFDPERELNLVFPCKSAFISSLLTSTTSKLSFKDLVLQVVLHSTPVFDPDDLPLPNEKPRDAFYMLNYKVLKCESEGCNDRYCFMYHSDDDRRRALEVQPNGIWNYKPDMCRRGRVCSGEDCILAHCHYEVDYHPMRYRTQPCRLRRNILGFCSLGVHCSFAHDSSELRTPSPNVLPVPSPPIFSDPKPPQIEAEKPSVTEDTIANLSLSELSRANLTTVTHRMIEELQAAQQEKMRFDLALKETKGKMEEVGKRIACALCRERKRSKLMSCGHSVCEICVQLYPKTCTICNTSVQSVLLKTGK